MATRPIFGQIIRYVTRNGEVVTGIVTASFSNNAVNIHLFRDGVNQEHIDPHVYTVSFAPVRPDGTFMPNTWHWSRDKT